MPTNDLNEEDWSSWEDEGDADTPDAELGPIPSCYPSEFAQVAFNIPNDKGVFAPFSFEGRRHMPPVYDSPSKDILLMCGRQVEKCLDPDTPVLRPNGTWVELSEVEVGSEVITLGGTSRLVTGRVVWRSSLFEKEGVKLTTRSGLELRCAVTHPVRQWQRWTEAGKLQVGDWVATVKKLATPRQRDSMSLDQVLYAAAWSKAYKTVDGSWVIRVKDPEAQQLFKHYAPELVKLSGGGSPRLCLSRKQAEEIEERVGAKLGERPPLRASQLGSWVSWLWSFGGHIGQKDASFAETREKLFELRGWLWALGVNSKLRTVAGYLRLTVGQRDSLIALNRYLRRPVVLPMVEPHPESLPPEARVSLQELESSGINTPSMRARGLRIKRPRALRRDKFEEILQHYSPGPYDPLKLEELRAHLGSDLHWEQITAIEPVKSMPCMDIQVEAGNSFVAGGIVVHNSTFLGNRALTLCALIPGFKVLYVSPSGIQTSTFSNDRLRVPIETSPLFGPLVKRTTQNVLEKVFANQSSIVLRSAFLSADRCRGIASYYLLLDEFQDLLNRHIPVIEPSLSHAPDGWGHRCYSGTPKSFDNNIEHYRSGRGTHRNMSTMGEWMVPCDHCGSQVRGGSGRFWQCLGEGNIAKEGLVCSRCHKRIDPQHCDAQWVHQQDGIFESYRIPQLMVGWLQKPEKWAKLWDTYGTYDRPRFYNEVLGLSLDNSDRPLMPAEMQAVSFDDFHMLDKPYGAAGRYPSDFLPDVWHEDVFAGIDWGLGTSSHTVMTLGTYIGGRFQTFWAHRFAGQETDFEVQLQLIVEILHRFKVKVCGTDFGFGAQHNDRLIRIFGPHRIKQFQHVGKQNQKVRDNAKLGRCTVFRTAVMADLINAIKRRIVGFPCWNEFAFPYAADFTNITVDYNESTRMMVYNHPGGTTDDTFHSWAYMFLASMFVIPRPDIIKPLQEQYNRGPQFGIPGPINQG